MGPGGRLAKLLIIEDSAAQRHEVRRVVAEAGIFDEILDAEDGIRGLKLLLQVLPDVVLCDLDLPGLDGEKLLRARSTRPELAGVPFVFLTASGDVQRRSRLLVDGASDAIAKPFHAVDLVARLRLHLRVKQLQDELVAKNAALERLATTDFLTGLRTRRIGEELLAVELERARRHGEPLALLMADLDHFKALNDRHGHLAGDAVLRGVSQLLQGELRATDVAARYGGEEILVILPHTPLDGAEALAERWRLRVEREAFRLESGRGLYATVSIGVAGCGPDRASPEQLIGAADRALYVAKQRGRNRVAIDRGDA